MYVKEIEKMLQISSPLYVTFLLNSGDTNISENCLLCKFKESLMSFRDKTRIHLSQVKWTPVSTVHQQPVSLPPCLFWGWDLFPFPWSLDHPTLTTNTKGLRVSNVHQRIFFLPKFLKLIFCHNISVFSILPGPSVCSNSSSRTSKRS